MIKYNNSNIDCAYYNASEVIKVYKGNDMAFYSTAKHEHNYANDYFTLRAITDSQFQLSGSTSNLYSLDSGATWNSIGGGTKTPTVTAGNTILWKKNN